MPRITRMNQCRTGMRARICWNTATYDCVLHVDESQRIPTVWACGRFPFSGHLSPDMHGYPDSWAITLDGRIHNEDYSWIETACEHSPRRVLLYSRVRLLRCMQQSVKRASENGDLDAMLQIIRLVREDKSKHFLSYSKDNPTQISYASKPEHVANNKARMRTSLGRYIRRHLRIGEEALSAAGLQVITREVFAHLVADDLNIKVVSGSEITDAYRDAIGGPSCMTGRYCGPIEIYARNPDKVNMVLYGDREARALLWTCNDGATVMDRIYPNDGPHVHEMWNWATDQGYVYRCDNHLPSGDHIRLSDDGVHEVTLKHIETFPYLDTFHFGDISGHEVLLSNERGDYPLIFDDTDGSYDGAMRCAGCGERIHDDSTLSGPDGNDYCADCFDGRFCACAHCGEQTPVDNITTVHRARGEEQWCEHCVYAYATVCAQCEAVWVSGEVQYVKSLDRYICDNCCEQLEECADCEELYEKLYECADGKWRCSECAETYE